MIKKAKLLLARIAQYLCATVLSIGLTGVLAVIGLISYEVCVNTHRGFLEMSDNNRIFLLVSLEISGVIALLGGAGFFRFQSVAQKIRLSIETKFN